MKWCESSLKSARLLWDQANCDWQLVACWASHWWIHPNQAKGWSKNVWYLWEGLFLSPDYHWYQLLQYNLIEKTNSGGAKPYLCFAFKCTALPQWSVDVPSQSIGATESYRECGSDSTETPSTGCSVLIMAVKQQCNNTWSTFQWTFSRCRQLDSTICPVLFSSAPSMIKD